MKNTIIFILLVILFCGCNEETYIENLIPTTKSFDLDKTIAIVTQKGSCLLNIEGNNYGIFFNLVKFKATSTNPSIGEVKDDSVMFVVIDSQLPIEIKNSTINKYLNGEKTNSSTTYGTSSMYLFKATKKSPYKTGYSKVPQIGNFVLNFGVNEDGYLAFNFTKDGIPLYGWVHITITEKNIICDKYGYQTFEAGKAGLK